MSKSDKIKIAAIYGICPFLASFIWKSSSSEWLKILTLLFVGMVVYPIISSEETVSYRKWVFSIGAIGIAVMIWIFHFS